MPGTRLIRDGLVEKDGEVYRLTGLLAKLSQDRLEEITMLLEQRILDYTQMRNPFAESNLDAVPGSVRYEVFKRAGDRCEACGASAKDMQIDVDHIVPRAHGGTNDISKLQALCRTCNAQERDIDDTNFAEIHDSYSDREADFLFCHPGRRVISENSLAYAMRDKYAVTAGHTLIIPKRHVAEYFDLHAPETKAVQSLLEQHRAELCASDKLITGFNVGANVGRAEGQTIFHVHIHLIPRREGDSEDPIGGVRNVIPGKGSYETV